MGRTTKQAGSALNCVRRAGDTILGDLVFAAGKAARWLSGASAGVAAKALADGKLLVTNLAATAGITIDVTSDGSLIVRARNGTGAANLYLDGGTSTHGLSLYDDVRYWGGTSYDTGIKRQTSGVVSATTGAGGGDGDFRANAFRFASGVSGHGIYYCSGTPEGALTAPVGSIALRTDGGAGTTLYVKQSGTGNTGWVAK